MTLVLDTPADEFDELESCVEVGDILDGRYRITRLIDRGGVGVVYEAENTLIGRRVAIKVLLAHRAASRAAIKRFKKEARAAGRMDSDHILDVLDVGALTNGQPYMVMELLQGEDLRHRLSKAGALPPGQIAELMRQALIGLRAAHRVGIIHRDLKPANLFLVSNKAGQRDFVKLIDFGVSKFQDDVSNTSVTKAGAIMGTPVYMSPEQVQGENEVDLRTDIYAVGVIMYEAAMGHLPFEGKSYNELLFKIVLKEPIPLRADIDQNFARIVAKAMARDPEDRYQSCDAFIAAVDDFLGRRSSEQPPPMSGRMSDKNATDRMPAVSMRSAPHFATVPMAVPDLEQLPLDHPARQLRGTSLGRAPVEFAEATPFPLINAKHVNATTLKSRGSTEQSTHIGMGRIVGPIIPSAVEGLPKQVRFPVSQDPALARSAYQDPVTLRSAPAPRASRGEAVVVNHAKPATPLVDTYLTERKHVELESPVVPIKKGHGMLLLGAGLGIVAVCVGFLLRSSMGNSVDREDTSSVSAPLPPVGSAAQIRERDAAQQTDISEPDVTEASSARGAEPAVAQQEIMERPAQAAAIPNAHRPSAASPRSAVDSMKPAALELNSASKLNAASRPTSASKPISAPEPTSALEQTSASKPTSAPSVAATEPGGATPSASTASFPAPQEAAPSSADEASPVVKPERPDFGY